ncbi:MAG TPA: hypothetical protein PLE37_10385 [Pseudomonadota bacterium]|nr:hypothetical protein [Pseudomonadota bacterium]
MTNSKTTRWWAMLVAACAMALPMALAVAAEEPKPGPVANEWFMWVTPGHEAQFEAAAKAHAAWRKQAGDPHTWNAYQATVGGDLTYYVYRAENLQWADVDAGNAWDQKAGATAHWNQNVNPHVARYEHYFGVMEPSMSYWLEAEDYAMYSVTTLPVNSGKWRSLREGMQAYVKAATDAKWDRSWSIERVIGGDGGVIVVRPLRNFAEMADPPVMFRDMLIKQMGSEAAAQATMDKVVGGLGAGNTTIYTWRKDLSTPK